MTHPFLVFEVYFSVAIAAASLQLHLTKRPL